MDLWDLWDNNAHEAFICGCNQINEIKKYLRETNNNAHEAFISGSNQINKKN